MELRDVKYVLGSLVFFQKYVFVLYKGYLTLIFWNYEFPISFKTNKTAAANTALSRHIFLSNLSITFNKIGHKRRKKLLQFLVEVSTGESEGSESEPDPFDTDDDLVDPSYETGSEESPRKENPTRKPYAHKMQIIRTGKMLADVRDSRKRENAETLSDVNDLDLADDEEKRNSSRYHQLRRRIR